MNINYTIYPEDSKDFPWDEEAVETFKGKIKEKGIECRMDDTFLLGFLRARKFDQERSLRLLLNYHKIRSSYPIYFKDLLPSKLQHVLTANIMHFMPKPDQDGRYVYILEMEHWDINVITVEEIFRTSLLYSDYMLNFHRTQVNSIVYVVNAGGMTLRKLISMSPRFVTSLATILFRDAYQLRIREVHYVNMNVLFKAFLGFFIPLLPAKIKSRIYLHTEMDTFHKFVHPEYLPKEFGGHLPPFDTTESNEMIRENEEFFRKNEEYIRLYEEDKAQISAEGKFRYLDEDEELNKLIKETELKYKELAENPERFISHLEQNSDFDITRL